MIVPIRPENKERYPKNWPEISRRIRDAAGNKCEWCGVPNGEMGGRTAQGAWLKARPLGDNGLRLEWPKEGEQSWCGSNEAAQMLRIVRIVLTVAHLDHTPENCDDDNLKSLCQRCHNRYDAPKRRAGILERARAGNAIGDLLTEENS